jgi:type IV secretory pathway VirB6-like protein
MFSSHSFLQPFWGLWGEHLKEIEGSFGSAVMITFAFLRWVFLLDVCLAILWMVAVIIPFFISPPSSFHWNQVKRLFQVWLCTR